MLLEESKWLSSSSGRGRPRHALLEEPHRLYPSHGQPSVDRVPAAQPGRDRLKERAGREAPQPP